MHNKQDKKSIIYNNSSIAHELTLNRIHRSNAMNSTLLMELNHHLLNIHASHTVSPIILRANGKNFCTGLDLDEATRSPEHLMQMIALLQTTLDLMRKIQNPIIIMIQGNVCGGGIGLLTCGDIVYANTDSMFLLPEINLGLAACAIAPYVSARIGGSITRYLLLSANTFCAQQAKHYGIIHEYFPDKKIIQNHVNNIVQNLKNTSHSTITAIHTLTAYHTNHDASHSDYLAKIWPDFRQKAQRYLKHIKTPDTL